MIVKKIVKQLFIDSEIQNKTSLLQLILLTGPE